MKEVIGIGYLKIISLGLSLFLFSCIGFFCRTNHDFFQAEKGSNHDRNVMINDLKKAKDSLEMIISKSDISKNNFTIEKQEVTILLNKINEAKNNKASIDDYKLQLNNLMRAVALLSKNKQDLELNYDLLKTQKDSIIDILNDTKQEKEILLETNMNLKKEIKKIAKVSVTDLKTNSFKQSSNGRLSVTNKASKVNVLQISFVVAGDKIVDTFDKEYYVQIIDSKNNIVGQRKTQKFGETILDYSYQTPIKVKNESRVVAAELLLDNAEKGNYVVNVFDKSELASKMTFALR